MVNFDEFDIEEYSKGYIPNKKFTDFLIKHNAYNYYIENIMKSDWDIKHFIEFSPVGSYISSAFNWAYSPQGTTYWNNINNMWMEQLGLST